MQLSQIGYFHHSPEKPLSPSTIIRLMQHQDLPFRVDRVKVAGVSSDESASRAGRTFPGTSPTLENKELRRNPSRRTG